MWNICIKNNNNCGFVEGLLLSCNGLDQSFLETITKASIGIIAQSGASMGMWRVISHQNSLKCSACIGIGFQVLSSVVTSSVRGQLCLYNVENLLLHSAAGAFQGYLMAWAKRLCFFQQQYHQAQPGIQMPYQALRAILEFASSASGG
jgi:hypothetical protein